MTQIITKVNNSTMKKLTFLLVSLFFINLSFSQEKALKISGSETNKEIIIKENKRIKIRTVNGEKIVGRFTIKDENTIYINGNTIDLNDITAIKRNQLLLSFFVSGLLVYAGALTAGLGAIIGIFANPTAFFLIIPGSAMIWAGKSFPNVNRNFKQSKNWKYEVISLPE